MKPVKLIIILLAVGIVVVLTAPAWGGCDINYKLCSGWCDIRYFNSSFEATACKGGCGADKLACLAQ